MVALWWSSTPNVSGPGDWITGAGRVLGLLAGYGVVVLVALMARLPPLERGGGADRLARWHAMGGRYVASLVVAHALLIIWGYAITAHAGVVSQTGTLLTSYPDVLMATVAGFMLLGIGLVSARAARRRMSYETCYYLHFYTYLAIALAFSHQFSVGASFVSSLPARGVWWSSHPYSLSALPRPDVMRITVKDRGDHSGGLARLRAGTRMIAEGPYGAFIPARSGRRVLLLAGGVGITPPRAMFAMLQGEVTRHDRIRHRRPAGGRSAAPPHPLRVVRVLTPPTMPAPPLPPPARRSAPRSVRCRCTPPDLKSS